MTSPRACGCVPARWPRHRRSPSADRTWAPRFPGGRGWQPSPRPAPGMLALRAALGLWLVGTLGAFPQVRRWQEPGEAPAVHSPGRCVVRGRRDAPRRVPVQRAGRWQVGWEASGAPPPSRRSLILIELFLLNCPHCAQGRARWGLPWRQEVGGSAQLPLWSLGCHWLEV